MNSTTLLATTECINTKAGKLILYQQVRVLMADPGIAREKRGKLVHD